MDWMYLAQDKEKVFCVLVNAALHLRYNIS